jgi:hypothetical protein
MTIQMKKRKSKLEITCHACGELIKRNSDVAWVPIGPGINKKERRKCRDGDTYNSIGIEIHWVCATGEESKEQ